MSQSKLSQDYARAVYALALEGWQKTLLAVEKALAADSGLLDQLNNKHAPFAERQEKLDAVLPDDVTEQERKFVYTLLQNGDLSQLGDVATGLTRLASKGPGIEAATVTTAVALTDDEKAQFQAKLSAGYGAELGLEFVVDGSILGGVIVQVGDKIIDGSVSGKLESIRERLISAV